MTNNEAVLRLGDREFEVFQLRKQGLLNKEIAKELEISCRTVDTHLVNIMCKGGFRNSAHLTAFNGEIIVGRQIKATKSERCKIIKEKLLQGLLDREIQPALGVHRNTYFMLKRLVLNEPGVKEKLNEINTPKPMFKCLRYLQ